MYYISNFFSQNMCNKSKILLYQATKKQYNEKCIRKQNKNKQYCFVYDLEKVNSRTTLIFKV